MEKILTEEENKKMSFKKKKEKNSEENSSRIKSVSTRKSSSLDIKSPREELKFALSPSSSNSKKQIYTPLSSERFSFTVTENKKEQTKNFSPISDSGSNDSDAESVVGSEKIKIFEHYNKTTRKKKKPEESLDQNSKILKLIEKLNDKIDSQNEIIAKLKNKKSSKEINTSKYLSPNASGKSTSESTEDEEEEKEEEKIPNYEDMDDEDREKYEILFETNFQLLKKSFPSLILNTPDVKKLSLRTIHIIYCNLVNTILIYQLAMKFKVFFIAGCGAIEYYGNKVYKIKVLKDLTLLQLKRIDRYSSFFVDCAKSVYGKFSGNYPEWMKFIFNAGTSFLSFITIQGISQNFNFGSASHDLLKEADKFVSPLDGTFKYRDDGIPDVPTVPEGLQNPDEILKRVPNVIKAVSGDIGNILPEEIVKEKKQEENPYGEVY